jgi:mannose-6-phosphate isomerase-like protein (cupin superfamily)
VGQAKDKTEARRKFLRMLAVSPLLASGGLGMLMAAEDGHKPLTITRMYTGPDGLSHFEEMELNLTPTNPGMKPEPGNTTPGKKSQIFAYDLLPLAGRAQLHRLSPGDNFDWHATGRRQYWITLSGLGQIEVAGGKKLDIGPGRIVLAEDLTGKGHITRNLGTEDHVMLFLQIADNAGK